MRNRALLLSALAVVLILFNIVAFVVPFNHTTTFWIGYGFTMLSIVLTFIGSGMVLGKGAEKTFMGMSIAVVLWGYFILQTIIGIVLLAASSLSYRAAILICAIPLLLAYIAVIASVGGNQHIEKVTEYRKEKTFYIQSLLIDVEGLEKKTDDASLRKSVRDLAEAVRYSDPFSSEKLAVLESKIESKTAELEELVINGDVPAAKKICSEISDLLVERNKKCKLLK